MINVLADQNLYKLKTYLPEEINLTLYDPTKGLPSEVDSFHGLLIRTVNPINKQTLPNIPDQLSFVGSASAGTDHVDTEYLKKNGVLFKNAAGCNARSVAEYVATALLIWSESRKRDLKRLSVGIVGVGQVGTQVIELLDKLEISTVAFDPPREERDVDFNSVSIDEILDCDILSLHTPLTTKGSYPTYHWLDDKKLNDRQYELVINTARGNVIDEEALLQAIAKDSVKDIIIDVWENEPDFNLKTFDQAFIKTPHIAGYAVQSKENATKIVVDAMLDHFGVSRPKIENQSNPRIIDKDLSTFDSPSSLLTELHPIREYESKMKKIVRDYPDERGRHFNKLRVEFPLRQDFGHTCLPASYFEKYPVLKALGFSIANH